MSAEQHGIKFYYLRASPHRYTFRSKSIKKFIEKRCRGKVLNLFAGKTILNCDEVRVDIDRECPADYYMDAFEFVGMAINKGWKFDTIILDPPWNYRKAREKYGGRWIGRLTRLKKELPKILNPGGIVISLGYNSGGMNSEEFVKKEIALVYFGGDHNDAIILVEEYIGK